MRAADGQEARTGGRGAAQRTEYYSFLNSFPYPGVRAADGQEARAGGRGAAQGTEQEAGAGAGGGRIQLTAGSLWEKGRELACSKPCLL